MRPSDPAHYDAEAGGVGDRAQRGRDRFPAGADRDRGPRDPARGQAAQRAPQQGLVPDRRERLGPQVAERPQPPSAAAGEEDGAQGGAPIVSRAAGLQYAATATRPLNAE